MRAALVTAVFLIGCAGSDPSPWHADTSFTPEERADILAGQALLEAHTGTLHREVLWDHTPGTAQPWSIVRETHDNGAKLDFDGTIYLGMTGRNREQFKAMVAHEFGHAAGMVHHDGDGIMNPVPLVFAWTDADTADCTTHCEPD